jgi:hypothetical protein
MAIGIGRRQFISALGGGAVAWPLAARAQQPTIPMIGFLLPGSKVASKQFFDGFPLGMQEKGYVEGRDYVLESRYADSGRYFVCCFGGKAGNIKHPDCRRQLDRPSRYGLGS